MPAPRECCGCWLPTQHGVGTPCGACYASNRMAPAAAVAPFEHVLHVLSCRTRCTRRCGAASRRPTRARPSGEAAQRTAAVGLATLFLLGCLRSGQARFGHGPADPGTSAPLPTVHAAQCCAQSEHVFARLSRLLAGSRITSTTPAPWRVLSMRCTAGARCPPGCRRPARWM